MLFIAHNIANVVRRLFSKFHLKKKSVGPLEDGGELDAGIESTSNLKDPESNEQMKDDCKNDQAAMFEEKKNCSGFFDRKDISEWLEDSFIEGGIQTFSPLENENSRPSSRNEADYLQFSDHSNEATNENEMILEDPKRTSTPTKLVKFPKNQSREFNILTMYTPQKLRKFLYEKCDHKKGLELTLDLSNQECSQCIVVDEQKKENEGENDSVEVDFVNTMKDKIRRKLMNTSYV